MKPRFKCHYRNNFLTDDHLILKITIFIEQNEKDEGLFR